MLNTDLLLCIISPVNQTITILTYFSSVKQSAAAAAQIDPAVVAVAQMNQQQPTTNFQTPSAGSLLADNGAATAPLSQAPAQNQYNTQVTQ